MSAMVEGWKGELTKLREKVMVGKGHISKAKEEQVVKKEAQKEIMAVERDINYGGTMSEATVCLLMDRFVPC